MVTVPGQIRNMLLEKGGQEGESVCGKWQEMGCGAGRSTQGGSRRTGDNALFVS